MRSPKLVKDGCIERLSTGFLSNPLVNSVSVALMNEYIIELGIRNDLTDRLH